MSANRPLASVSLSPRAGLGLLLLTAFLPALCACGSKKETTAAEQPAERVTADPSAATAPAASKPMTRVNDFYQRGEPTYILGTAGDERADRAIAVQVDLMRNILQRGAVVNDSALDVSRGASAWPKNPVVYGGAHVNSVMAALAPTLPFTLQDGYLAIGEDQFRSPEMRLIAVIPARAADEKGPGYPEFLLYAGTGTPGIGEINAVFHGPDPVLIADGFGRLQAATWQRSEAGTLALQVTGHRSPRIEWRAETRELAGAAVRFWFPASIPKAKGESEAIAAGMRGLQRAVKQLQIAEPAPMSVYVHPDRNSKRSLTGDHGAGHAVVAASAVHVVADARSDALASLLAHEGAHVQVYRAYGPAATALIGEGLAVWSSGGYAGLSLARWQGRLTERPEVTTLLGADFRKIPERERYPLAGMVVQAAVLLVGVEQVATHLLPATAATWAQACERAGTSADAVQSAFSALQ